MTGRRRLGRTGISISKWTIGTAGLGHSRDQAGAARALSTALDYGVNAIEIGLGDQRATAQVASVLEQMPGRDIHIMARAAPQFAMDLPSSHFMADQVYPGTQLRAQVEAALREFGVDRLGLVHLHAWCPEWLGEGDWQEVLSCLRQEGKIAGYGISLFDHDVDAGLSAVASGEIDSVEVMYNIFDQGAARQLLPLCAHQSVAAITRSPLYYGMLVPDGERPTFAADDWRSGFFFDAHLGETIERSERLEHVFGASLAEIALRFSLSHPAVFSVAVGVTSVSHVEGISRAMAKGVLSEAELSLISEHRWLC